MNPSSAKLPPASLISARAAKLAGLGLVLTAFTGCATDDAMPFDSMVSASVESAPAAPRPATNRATFAVQAPPASRKEAILDRPSPRHVWVSGYWVLSDGKYDWVAGRWELPPRGKDTWVAPRWQRRDNGYAFSEGFWR